MPDTDSAAAAKPGYYLFEVPGVGASIYLSLDVVDRLQQDVMRGFGAVPKRGAEIGGILLGTARQSGRLVVEIEDYVMTPIEYKRGPSYLLSAADLESFRHSLERLRQESENNARPVGFFRSQTRDAAGLVDDDLELLNRFFPDPKTVVLMIKPYGTRTSMATCFIRQDGVFPRGAPDREFPFRRKELAPHDMTQRPSVRAIERPSPELVARAAAKTPRRLHELSIVPHDESIADQSRDPEVSNPRIEGDELDKPRNRWLWIPVSFIFLLLGVLLGFQAALTLKPQASAASDPFNLQLTVSKEGDNLNVRWDRQALAIRAANRGVLTILDGGYSKTVDLDPNQLQTGSVVYRHNSGEVGFRLEVYPRERDIIVESVQWKE